EAQETIRPPPAHSAYNTLSPQGQPNKMPDGVSKRPRRECVGKERGLDGVFRPVPKRRQRRGDRADTTSVDGGVTTDLLSGDVKKEGFPYLKERADIPREADVKGEGEGEGRERGGEGETLTESETVVKQEGFPPLKEVVDLPLCVPVKHDVSEGGTLESGEGYGLSLSEKAEAHRQSVNALTPWIYSQKDTRLEECGRVMGEMVQDLFLAGKMERDTIAQLQRGAVSLATLNRVYSEQSARLQERERECIALRERVASLESEREREREREGEPKGALEGNEVLKGDEEGGMATLEVREVTNLHVDTRASSDVEWTDADFERFYEDKEGTQAPMVKAIKQLRSCGGTELNLYMTSMGADGAKALAVALPSMTALTKLDLNMNGIGDVGAKALAVALPSLTALTHLSLGSNSIGDVGAKALAVALPSLTALTYLGLDNNNIGDIGAKALAVALPSLTALTSVRVKCCSTQIPLFSPLSSPSPQLRLENNSIGRDGGKAVRAAVRRGCSVSTLSYAARRRRGPRFI
ncbi:hypothetical protein KIPB_006775, partial [Kipferlia bialata]